jgi:5-methylcytosine-specific restriction endonuclease McrA
MVRGFDDALRGYAHLVFSRDGFKCVYCGLDGSSSFSAWLSLSWDHLLPKGDPRRDDHEFIVTACMFCNVADNQYFARARERGISFTGKSRGELVVQRLPYVERTRAAYRAFWEERVRGSG